MTATLLHLREIIEEAGGVAAFGVERAIRKTRDLFSMIETGTLSVREAGRAFNELFGAILPEAIDRTTGLASQAFVELVALNDRFGTESKQVADFVRGELGRVIDGLQTFVAHATVSSQAAASAMADAAVAAFEALIRRGASLPEVVTQLDPIVAALSAQFERAGFTGGDAFTRLQQLAALARDELAGPALQAVAGLRDVLTGLANTGLLTQDTFAGLAQQISETFQRLVAQGADGHTALALMQPTLQTLWELQRRYGFAVDEATAALLRQAEEAGLVGAQHQDAMTRAAAALERVADVLERLIGQTGTWAGQLAQLPRTISVDIEAVWRERGRPEFDVPGLQAGGIVMRPTVALLGEREAEAVVPLSQLRAVAGGEEVVRELRALGAKVDRLPWQLLKAVKAAAAQGRMG